MTADSGKRRGEVDARKAGASVEHKYANRFDACGDVDA